VEVRVVEGEKGIRWLERVERRGDQRFLWKRGGGWGSIAAKRSEVFQRTTSRCSSLTGVGREGFKEGEVHNAVLGVGEGTFLVEKE